MADYFYSGQVMGDKIKSVTVRDIRFPTSLEKDGSDAMVSCKVESLNQQRQDVYHCL